VFKETFFMSVGCRLGDQAQFCTESRNVLAWINIDKGMEIFITNWIGWIIKYMNR